MEKIIPLISSDTVGPLGVKHLPRLWLKTLLASAGRLPEGYKDIRPGFDYMVLEGLKIAPDAARAYIMESRPGYLGFEAWVRAQEGVDLTQENIAAVNRIVTERKKGPESRLQLLAENGLPEDSPIESSIMLNNLDDWRSIHAILTPAPPPKPTVLILCTGNSCRSQMAEGILRAVAGDLIEVVSAGSKPAGKINARAMQVMQEIGIDISGHRSKHMSEFFERSVHTVITVCGNVDQACPMFPGQVNRHHWGFDDPHHTQGTEEVIMTDFRRVRDQMRMVFGAYAAGLRHGGAKPVK
ncbi:hypothetical protein ASA1KI_22800 [Opitutales bacterium ASA1]|uniref:arsenate reductase/protein-tyrosine-phosphatase family protein n=1 Tax=Congregicoccus parvus TaxID=3081749 RepID=UPI002B28D2B7|nr:hypothetical protein ASA1KI_22800 [Opitutales bacterium ASA1]